MANANIPPGTPIGTLTSGGVNAPTTTNPVTNPLSGGGGGNLALGGNVPAPTGTAANTSASTTPAPPNVPGAPAAPIF